LEPKIPRSMIKLIITIEALGSIKEITETKTAVALAAQVTCRKVSHRD